MDLNEAQARAAQAPSDSALKVEAGAGTGKTNTLVHRYCKLMLEDNIAPDRILALTFTRKAASEMRERIFTAVATHNDQHLYRALYSASITNFHSFCYRFIWQDPTRFSVHPEFSVATDVEISRIKRVLYRDFTARRIDGIAEEPVDPDMTPGRLHAFFTTCCEIIEKCRGLTIRPEDLQHTVKKEDEPGYERHVTTVIALWNEYEKRLESRKLLDFTGLIDCMVRSLENDTALRDELAGRFDYILVDEFQDTSGAQNRLLQLLSGGAFENVTVVGDEKQSIYRWRDARADNLREFEGGSEPLTINYRSRQEILDLAVAFIARDSAYGARVQKLKAERGPGPGAITLYHPAEMSGQAPAQEARALSAWIRRLTVGEHIPDAGPLEYEKIAILLRSLKPAAGLAAIETELRRHNFPYAIVGATASLENGVLLSLKHLLTLVIHLDEADSVESLLYLLEEQPFSFTDEELMNLFHAARVSLKERGISREDLDRSLTSALLLSDEILSAVGSEEKRRRSGELAALLRDLNNCIAVLDFPSFIGEVLEKGCVFLRLFDSGAETAVVDTVLEIVCGIVEELMQKNEAAVSACIEHLDSITGDETRSGGAEPYLPPGRIAIMTIHQAKGLEFDAVAVPGLRKKRAKGLPFYVSDRNGMFLQKYKGRETKDCEEALRYKDEIKREERCLIYVAMTRARDFLFLSSPEPGEERDEKKSNYFTELLECLDAEDIPRIEWRDSPEVSQGSGRGEEPVSPPETNGRELLASWRTGHERMLRDRILEPGPCMPIRSTTWRALKSFAACPLQYHCTYIRGAPADLDLDEFSLEPGAEPGGRGRSPASPVAGIDSTAYGTFVHHILERIVDGGRTTPGEIEPLLRREAALFDFSAATIDDLLRQLPPLVGPVLEAHANSTALVAYREQPFYLRLGRLLFTGVIDRVDRAGDRYRIIDYKTGAVKEEHRFQVRYYSWAWSKIVQTKAIQGYLWYVRANGGEESVDTGSDALSEMESTAVRLDEAAASNRYDASPGAVCETCEYMKMCPYARS